MIHIITHQIAVSAAYRFFAVLHGSMPIETDRLFSFIFNREFFCYFYIAQMIVRDFVIKS